MRLRAAATDVAVVTALLLAGCSSSTDPADAGPAGANTASVPPPAPEVSAEDRAAHTMTPLADGTLLVAGGCVVDGCATATSSVVRISPEGDRAAAPMTVARDAHTATLLADGRVLVTGGFVGEGDAPLATAEIYDPLRDTWTAVGDLAVGRGGHAAALLGDGRVVVVGGWVSSGTYTQQTEIFDPETGRFSRGPDLPVAVDGLAAASLPDGSALVVGGQQSPGEATDQAVRIDADGTLHRLFGLRHARFKHALVSLPSGEALAVGGTIDDVRLLRSTELFDLRTGRFQPGPTLLDGRYKLAGSAAALPDGRVLVAGGGPGAEVLGPRRGTAERVPGPTGVASFSTVGLLGDAVLVLGGYDEQIRLTGTRHVVPVSDLD
ncbi:MAG TPA: kelch repeat-containing protein [Actinomycetes bacterium]|nr:kelch repeat-containing protein [Actinomycetes bacterium]